MSDPPVPSAEISDFEKLGIFYLGRDHDLASGKTSPGPLLYDAKDLTTHAVCVGMTGSGKTGLCIALLEEAAIDGIPAIAIDPKGDLANLFLTFPELRPDDFRPWIDESEAARKGVSPDEFATQTAELWKSGLADWQQDGARIQRFRDAIDLAIYTPGSTAGQPLSVLRSFAAPSAELLHDVDALRERVSSAASGLLALLDIDADPMLSREHILISNLLEHAWRGDKNLSLADLIRGIQEPPFTQLGVIDIETAFPSKDRLALSLRLNNLLASPSFAAWMEGDPLDVQRLLYTSTGQPRLSIVSIAHLSDAERMFFVTMLLNEVLAWVRQQSGTSSLRALLYMDEVFGYFPPTATPPSKKPMLTLLKQARAFGVGIVLATQNPVDLDYKGLSNTGTWFLGRLQTERDKARVLEGLEGASTSAGASFDRGKMEATLAGLGKRVFLMNNVHEDAPTVFKTRWALSYLAGPLTRTQIQKLAASKQAATDPAADLDATAPGEKASASASPGDKAADDSSDDLFGDLTPIGGRTAAAPLTPPPQPSATFTPAAAPATSFGDNRPILSSGIDERFLSIEGAQPDGAALVLRPALIAETRLHFVKSGVNIDHWDTRSFIAPLDPSASAGALCQNLKPWSGEFPEETQPPQDSGVSLTYAPLPDAVVRSRGSASCERALRDELYRSQKLETFTCAAWKEHSQPGESEADFRVRLRQRAFEERDDQLEQLRDTYADKAARLKQKITEAEARVRREESQYREKQVDTGISFGSSILGAIFGRKWASRTNVNRASTSMRKASQTAGERADVKLAEEKLEDLQKQLQTLDGELKAETERIQAATAVDAVELETNALTPRKSDIAIDHVALVWTPWWQDAAGNLRAAFRQDNSWCLDC